MTLKLQPSKAFSLIEISIVILIIGILIVGVIAGSRFYNRSRLISAATMTQSSPVSGIKDLTLWVDTTSINSFDNSETNDGDLVSNWYDINPQAMLGGNKFSQTSSGAKPTYKPSSLNGLPSLYFDGSSSTMGTTAISSDNLLKDNNFTFFIVAKFPTPITTTAVFFQYVDNSGARILGVEFNDTLGQIRLDSSNISIYSPAGTIAFGKGLILSGYRSSSATVMHYNGSQIASGSSGLNQTISGELFIGSYQGNEHFTAANIGEVIVYGRSLTSEERKSVEKYLSQKWGIAISQ